MFYGVSSRQNVQLMPRKPQTLVVIIMMTQIEDDVYCFSWSDLNFRIVPDAWSSVRVCVFFRTFHSTVDIGRKVHFHLKPLGFSKNEKKIDK